MIVRPVRRTAVPVALALLAGLAACNAKSTTAEGSGQVGVAIEPPAATVPAGGATQFAAVVTGSAVTGVTWSVVEAGGGTVDASGHYTAPAAAGTYHVEAVSVADPTRLATAAVTVQPPSPPPPPVVVAVAPATAALDACQSATFTATVTGTSNGAVTWSVQEGAAGGSVTTAGVYTAPQAAGTYHVVAASVAAPASIASVAVTVTERVLGVTVDPPTVTVSPAGTATFTATVTTTCGAVTALRTVAVGAPLPN